MSKQSQAKEKQGFVKKSPTCSNCVNFSMVTEEYRTQWSSQVFTRESNFRCKLGEFKVGKSNWCKLHSFGKASNEEETNMQIEQE
jgi:hypothetical protein